MASDRNPGNPANLYVAGLPTDFDDAALRQLFSRFGAILTTKYFPRPGSVGYGFVNFGSSFAAQRAIAAMDGSDYRGVALEVRIAGQEKRSGGYPGALPGANSNVYVANWPTRLTEDAFRKAFEPFGKIVSLRLCTAKSQGGRVYGFVHFEGEAAAHKAIHSMNGAQYDGMGLQVRIANKDDAAAGGTNSNAPQPVESRVFLSNERLFGIVDAWKGKYGWILPKKSIKHATAVMHNGRVYVHTKDFEGISELKEGDAVSFLAYTDNDGLGAASVRLEDHLDQGGGEDQAGHEAVSSTSKVAAARGPHWRRTKTVAAGGDADKSIEGAEAGSAAAKGGADIYVKGWPAGLTDADFRQVFEQFGSLLTTDLRVDQSPGTAWAGRKHGYARFSSSKAAEAAVEAMDSVVYGGVPLQVSLSGDDASPSLASTSAVVEPGLQSQVRVGEGRYFGKVVLWKGKFGWVSPERRIENIDEQPLVRAVASRHHGRIYVNERDIEGASELSVGDRVSFVVYADWDGLGGSEVRREARADPATLRKEVRTRIRPLAAPHISASRPQSRHSSSQIAAGNGTTGKKSSSSKSAVGSNSESNTGGSDASGPNAAANGGTPASSPAPPAAWWHGLAGDCCPISLTPFEELEQEPFGLLATAEAMEEPQDEGLWGAGAVAAYYSMQAVHWFHGLFLACSLVSSVQFMDPVSLRRLSRGECESLDRYLAFHSFPAVHVGEAFDLGRQVASTGDGNRTDASERLAALGRDAASIMRIADEGEAPPVVTATLTSSPVAFSTAPAASDTAALPSAEAAPTEAAVAELTAGKQDVEVPAGEPAGTDAGGSLGMSTTAESAATASTEPVAGTTNPKEGGRRRRWQK